MTTLKHTSHDGQLAKTLAGEDLRQGDVVAILDVIQEYPSFLWCDDPHVLPPHEPVYVRCRGQHTGKPLKVKAICLPYILVKTPKGRHKTLDLRQCRLVRLGDGYARTAWKRFRKAGKKDRKQGGPRAGRKDRS
jgi:hypothetical protein